MIFYANKTAKWFGASSAAQLQTAESGPSAALWRLQGTGQHGFMADTIADAHLLCIHLMGTMEWAVKANDRAYRAPCNSDTFCLARAGESAEIEFANPHLSFLHLYLPVRWFESDLVGAASRRVGQTIELIDPMNRVSFRIARLARQVVCGIRMGARAGRLKIDTALVEIATELVRNHSTATPASFAKGGLSPFTMRRVVDYMVAHLADTVTLAELARLADVTAPHFCRAFADTLGVSPHRYHTTLRLERATQLLLHTNLPVADIGHQVGYDDPSYFSRIFAQYSGFTPSDWRDGQRL